MTLGVDRMTSGKKCKVKDNLVNQLIALNNKLNTLSHDLLHGEQARAEVQERRESLHGEIKHHRAKGHEGKPCPAIQRFVFSTATK
jgi:hypothetical protein